MISVAILTLLVGAVVLRKQRFVCHTLPKPRDELVRRLVVELLGDLKLNAMHALGWFFCVILATNSRTLSSTASKSLCAGRGVNHHLHKLV